MQGSLLWLTLVLLSFGCSTHEYRVENQRSGPEPTPIEPPASYSEQSDKPADATTTKDIARVEVAAESSKSGILLDEAPAISGIVSGRGFGAQAPGKTAPAPPPPVEVANRGARTPEMIDLEARVELEVDAIDRALQRVRSIVAAAGGQVVNEVIEDRPHTSGVALSVRVPSAKTHDVLAELARVGKLLSRKVEAKDIGREYSDAQILLRNLEATMKRYEELLTKAQAAPEVLEIERELSRVRTQIERVKGDLRWLSDRAARSTIYVTLRAPQGEGEIEPEAKLHPGVRGVALFDLSASEGTETYLGAGASVAFTRIFSVDADWLTRTNGGDGLDLFLATAGSELYSDLLGGGRRRFLNPYLGFRLGYVWLNGDDGLALGAVVGVELWKTESIVLDLQTRVLALLDIEDSTHVAIQPALGLNIAY